jgi:hypothetical protein
MQEILDGQTVELLLLTQESNHIPAKSVDYKEENEVSVYYEPYSVNRRLPLIHRQVAQSSRGFARNSSRVSLVNSYFSILSFEKSTAVICDCTFARH